MSEEEVQPTIVPLPIEIKSLELGMDIATCLLHAQVIAHTINRGPGGREMALCITKLEEAQHRLDDTLRALHAK